MAIVTRAGKGSELTHAELDNNFSELASRSGTKVINEAGLSDGKMLVYDSTSGKLVYMDIPEGGPSIDDTNKGDGKILSWNETAAKFIYIDLPEAPEIPEIPEIPKTVLISTPKVYSSGLFEQDEPEIRTTRLVDDQFVSVERSENKTKSRLVVSYTPVDPLDSSIKVLQVFYDIPNAKYIKAEGITKDYFVATDSHNQPKKILLFNHSQAEAVQNVPGWSPATNAPSKILNITHDLVDSSYSLYFSGELIIAFTADVSKKQYIEVFNPSQSTNTAGLILSSNDTSLANSFGFTSNFGTILTQFVYTDDINIYIGSPKEVVGDQYLVLQKFSLSGTYLSTLQIKKAIQSGGEG